MTTTRCPTRVGVLGTWGDQGEQCIRSAGHHGEHTTEPRAAITAVLTDAGAPRPDAEAAVQRWVDRLWPEETP